MSRGSCRRRRAGRTRCDRSRRRGSGRTAPTGRRPRSPSATVHIVPEDDPDLPLLAADALAAACRSTTACWPARSLDQLCANRLASADLAGAAAAISRREQLLADVAIDASTGFELGDLHLMALGGGARHG